MKLSNMRNVRTEKGITQTQLAERIGSRQPYMSAIEKGMPASDEMARRIAAGLGCGVSELVGAEEPTITLKLSDLPPELLATLTRK